MPKIRTVNGASYQFGEMNALDQVYIARRLLPHLLRLMANMPALAKLRAAVRSALPQPAEGITPAPADPGITEMDIKPFLDILDRVNDDEIRQIVMKALTCVRRNSGTDTVPHWTPVVDDDLFRFHDIESNLVTMATLTVIAVGERLGPFLPALRSI